jgi:nitrate reductase NapD
MSDNLPSRREIMSGRLSGAPQEAHISSLVVHGFPERIEAVQAALRAMHGVEIHGASGGKLVLTLETDTEADIVTRLNEISFLPGVLSATLVFHHYEALPVRSEG